MITPLLRSSVSNLGSLWYCIKVWVGTHGFAFLPNFVFRQLHQELNYSVCIWDVKHKPLPNKFFSTLTVHEPFTNAIVLYPFSSNEVQISCRGAPAASHFCRDNLLWGGHPARPLALTGFPACPTRKCICTIGMLPGAPLCALDCIA